MNTLSSSSRSIRVDATTLSPKWTIDKDRIDAGSPSITSHSSITVDISMTPSKAADQTKSKKSYYSIMKKDTTASISEQRLLRTRKVRFSNDANDDSYVKVEVQPIETIKSKSVKSKLWYTSQDLGLMLKSDFTIITLMDMGYTDEKLMTKSSPIELLRKYSKKEVEEMTTRGLERQSKIGMKRFKLAKQSSVDAVLQCQRHERMMHRFWPVESIAAAYVLTTAESQKASIRRAMKDAMYVRNHCIQPGDCNISALRQLQQQQTLNKKCTTTMKLFGLR